MTRGSGCAEPLFGRFVFGPNSMVTGVQGHGWHIPSTTTNRAAPLRLAPHSVADTFDESKAALSWLRGTAGRLRSPMFSPRSHRSRRHWQPKAAASGHPAADVMVVLVPGLATLTPTSEERRPNTETVHPCAEVASSVSACELNEVIGKREPQFCYVLLHDRVIDIFWWSVWRTEH